MKGQTGQRSSFRDVARLVAAGLVLGLALVLGSAPAAAEKRIALVIGNGKYDGAIGPLANPPRDAEVMGKQLAALGFQVVKLVNGDQKAMKRAISDFGGRLLAAGPDAVGLFFYAGHGVQIRGINYLIPVGAAIEREADAELEAVNAEWVLDQMSYAGNSVNIMLLDACRNNPLTRSFRSADRGLARMDAPTGTFVGYSTAPGEVAADGTGENSPYVAALASEMGKPGIALEETFRNVRVRVMAETDQRQVPWDSSSLTGAFYFRAPQQTAAIAPQPAAPAAQAATAATAGQEAGESERLFWESIKDSSDPAEFEAYLAQYPNGHYSGLARLKVSRLSGASQAGNNQAANNQAGQQRTAEAAQPTQPAAPVQSAAVEPPAPAPATPAPAISPPAAASGSGLVLSSRVAGELDRYLRILGPGKSAFAVSANGEASGFFVCEMANQCVPGKRTLQANRDPNYARKEAVRLCESRGQGSCEILMLGDKKQLDFSRP
ncbi:putative caspase-like protein [Dongia mobilis]|uniref:Putative caspase-like protein n=1 Tax=Dongia mobilis TaxID=578943 RepID=A0A4R6X0R8_9PROT|nr:caspase family protein [Dongia mobilis]TDQ84048.1 putative caspase-like protein [Dongia mobilis]